MSDSEFMKAAAKAAAGTFREAMTEPAMSNEMKRAAVKDEIEASLNALSDLFASEAQLSFIMRVPGDDDAYMVVSNDNLREVADLLLRSNVQDKAST